MGRHAKTVVAEDGLDRRDTGYYSTPDFVADYFFKRLMALKPNASTIYDPCVGHGELLRPFRDCGATLLGTDVLDMSSEKFFEFEQRDYLMEAASTLDHPLLESKLPKADIIVANPPYNCHEHDYLKSSKDYFTRIFGKSAFLNFYSLFMTAIIRTADRGTAIGLITLDSFLTARGHEPLRQLIKEECSVREILLCPTDLFRSQGADVRTCILILEKGAKSYSPIRALNRPISSCAFREALSAETFEVLAAEDAYLDSARDRGEFLIGVPSSIKKLFAEKRIEDLFECNTGISTGNDGKYLSAESKEGFTVPFYKNPGNRRFYTEPDAYLVDNYLEIARQVPNFMVRNKSSIGRSGITCSSMGVSFGAALMPSGGAFGVNANIFSQEEDLWWLLAYLNSSLCNYLVRGVLLRSNMITAGYVSRIPVPELDSATRSKLERISRVAYDNRPTPDESKVYTQQIDEVLYDALGFSEEDRLEIDSFCRDIIRRT